YQGELPDISRYDTVIIGHPTWWGIPPRIIETVIGHMDFTGKTVATFATSGGSGYSGAQQIIDGLLGPDVKPGAVLSSPASVDAWLKQAGLE
ncbi:MAG: flavodoxin, partial [Scardovia wiggsiae]